MPTPPSFDPRAEWASFRDAMRHFMSEAWEGPRDLMPAAFASVLVPIDLLDTGTALVVRANMPGVDAGSLSITVTGDTLAIEGKVKTESDAEGTRALRRERRATTYSRSLALPVLVDADHAQASIHDGVLTLTLPKTEPVPPKTIKVSV